MAASPDLGALGQVDRLGKPIGELPVEVILGNAEDFLGGSIGTRDAVLERLAAQMRVRHHADQFAIDGDRRDGGQFDVVLIRRKREAHERGVATHQFLLGRLFRENEADLGLIRGRLSVRRVVKLEHDIGTGLQQRRAMRTFGRGANHLARHVSDETAVELAATGGAFRRHENVAGLLVANRRAWITQMEVISVMHHRAVAWANLSRDHPLYLR